MTQQDTYSNLAHLEKSEWEGRDFRRLVTNRGSPVAIIVPHGGGIEPGTSEVGRGVAGEDFSFYCFESLKPANGSTLHITSVRFDDPVCLTLVSEARIILSIHGCRDVTSIVNVGGTDVELRRRMVHGLTRARFHAEIDGTNHSGTHPNNIINRGSSKRAVQLELSLGLRRTFFRGLGRRQRKFTTPEFTRFVDLIRRELLGASTPADSTDSIGGHPADSFGLLSG